MKFFHVYLLSLILLFFFVLISLWVFQPAIFAEKFSVLSPLPDFLTKIKNKEVTTIDIFQPKTGVVKGSSLEKPQIFAKSVFVFDLSTKKTLYEMNIRERLPMASITKIMTAIIALENPKDDDRYQVSGKDLVGENSMGLTNGEVVSLDELLYGLILVSGNDSAEVLADNFLEGRTAFIQAMNLKAQSLGLKDTNFTNPSGLQGDGDQYSTAYDLFLISNYALENFPLFRKVAATFQYEIPKTNSHKYFYLENETNLISSYPGVKGVKTGYTPEAGLCLITYLEYKNHRIIAVLLGSNNRREEMKELLDYSLKVQGIVPPNHP